jgi:hypothetical protein
VVGQNQVGVLYGENMKNPMDTDRTVPFTPTIGIGLTTTNPKTGKMTTAPAAVAKQSLTARGDNVTVTSTSGNYSGQAAAFISSGGVRGISADATTSAAPPPAGNAAARAYDPFEIPSGSSYVYDPTITATVELDSPDASGGIAAFAVDSSVFTTDSVDNFTADGTPLNDTLWYLSVGGDTPTTSTSDVLVDFELNPLALNEIMFPSSFLASIGPYSDTDSEALLIDQALDQSIASQLALNGDAVDLNGVDPFPTGTMFQAISGGVEYADDVDAVVSAAPEPASLVLLSGSLVILAGSRRVSKSARMTGEDSRL